MNITEIHNSAAIGWRWDNGRGAVYEIAWTRGATRLRFGVKSEQGARARVHEFIATC